MDALLSTINDTLTDYIINKSSSLGIDYALLNVQGKVSRVKLKKHLAETIAQKEVQEDMDEETRITLRMPHNTTLLCRSAMRLHEPREEFRRTLEIPEVFSAFSEKIRQQSSRLLSLVHRAVWESAGTKPLVNTSSKVFQEEISLELRDLEDDASAFYEQITRAADEGAFLSDCENWSLIETCCDPTDVFIGRASELSALETLYQDNNPVFVNGPGGSGKSELCRRFVWEHFRDGGTRIVWLNYKGNITDTVAEELMVDGFPEGSNLSNEVLFDLKMRFVSALGDVLLIVDDYDFAAGDIRLLEYYSCRVIATTRYRNIPRSHACVTVGDLPAAEAMSLLYSLTDEDIHPWIDGRRDKIEGLLGQFDFNTALTTLLGGLISSAPLKDIDFEKCLFEISKSDIVDISGGDTVNAMLVDHVRKLFVLSDLNEPRRNLLRMASMLPDGGFDLETFLRVAHPIRYQDESAEAACRAFEDFDVNDPRLEGISDDERTLTMEMGRANWLSLRRDRYLRCDVVILHPLVRELVKEDLSPTEYLGTLFMFRNVCSECILSVRRDDSVSAARLVSAVESIAPVFERLYGRIDPERAYEVRFAVPVMYCQAHRYRLALERYRELIPHLDDPSLEPKVRVAAMVNLGTVFDELGDEANSARWWGMAAASTDGSEVSELTQVQGELGMMYVYIPPVLPDPSARARANILRSRAMDLGSRKRYADAIGVFLDAMACYQSAGDPNMFGECLTQIATCYRAVGDDAQAIWRTLNNAWDILSEYGDASTIGAVRYMLADFFWLGGMYDDAYDIAKAAEEDLKGVYLWDDSNLLPVYRLLATICRDRGDSEESESYRKLADEISRDPLS